MQYCIFEDKGFENIFPLSYLRPVYDLRCGINTLAEKIQRLFPKGKFYYHTRDHLLPYLQKTIYNNIELKETDTWFINGRVIADINLKLLIAKQIGTQNIIVNKNDIIALFIRKENIQTINKQLLDKQINFANSKSIQKIETNIKLIKYPWDLVNYNSSEIRSDYEYLRQTVRKKKQGKIYPGVHLLNKKDIVIKDGAKIYPGVVLDAEHGPIIIDKNVVIMPNAVIQGPVYIGESSIIKIGAKIYHDTSIGPFCKVGGEVECSIIQSYSNKQHDGFLGHSYLGSWVNIGADTNTSDLKNTYGTVKVHLNGIPTDTNSMFVGLTMGDHSKTGINVMFDTGTIVGVGCNIYGSGLPPKYIPSFSWGGDKSFVTHEFDKCLDTARRSMARRYVKLTSSYENIMKYTFEQTKSERIHLKMK